MRPVSFQPRVVVILPAVAALRHCREWGITAGVSRYIDRRTCPAGPAYALIIMGRAIDVMGAT